MALILIGAVFVLFRVGNEAGISSEAPTLTLPLDVQATQRMRTNPNVRRPAHSDGDHSNLHPTHTCTFPPPAQQRQRLLKRRQHPKH
ncbi:MAG: hypothetical protein HS103_00505 [Anaerolineales bacterium]|nr:hypothetical protein [Anaerolineales bacterium]